MVVLQAVFWIVGLALQFVVLSSLLGGRVREFLALFLYTISLFVTTVLDIIFRLDEGRMSRTWSQVFWTGDFIRLAGLYAIVISLIVYAVPSSQQRVSVRRLLIVLAVLFWAGCFWLQHHDNPDLWMTYASRNLSFCLALVNLGLWLVLIAVRAGQERQRNQILLMISGGLGVQMTCDAIAQSLRHLSPHTVLVGNILGVLGHFACLYIWWQALAKNSVSRPETPSPVASLSR
ncbi:MAG TPA: hypothetical protein VFL57_13765 [Bryobacteraceae bacterium]|nr:hypothetical protein [Bryobacteraceae bacterium]